MYVYVCTYIHIYIYIYIYIYTHVYSAPVSAPLPLPVLHELDHGVVPAADVANKVEPKPYISVYIYIYIYIYIHIYIYIYTYILISLYTYIYIYIHTHIHTHVYIANKAEPKPWRRSNRGGTSRGYYPMFTMLTWMRPAHVYNSKSYILQNRDSRHRGSGTSEKPADLHLMATSCLSRRAKTLRCLNMAHFQLGSCLINWARFWFGSSSL